MRRSSAVVLGVGCVLASFAGVVGASRLGSGSSRPTRSRGVVILSIDTLRADALDRDGATGISSVPSLDAFARGGVRFTGAIAPSTWTAPSLVTLMTGVVPLRHGVLEPVEGTRLPRGVPTLASTLHAAGWHTSAATGGAWAGPSTGVDAGFDTFHQDFDDAPAAAAIERWSETRPPERPFLLWLHTYVAHDPYGGKDADREGTCDAEVAAGRDLAAAVAGASTETEALVRREFVVARLANPCRRRGLDSVLRPRGMWDCWQRCLPWVNGGWRADPEDVAAVARIRLAYTENLSTRVDRRVRETLAALERAVALDDVAVFVVSDHGEGFGEHEVLSHGSRVTEDLARVPMLARGPGFPKAAATDEPCGLEDVMPTVLELAGLPPPAHLDGVSLLRVAAGRSGGRPIETVAVPLAAFGGAGEPPACRVAVRSREAAWIATYDFALATWEEQVPWFDRLADPGERTPLARCPSAADRPALRDAIDAARARVERRYGRAALVAATR